MKPDGEVLVRIVLVGEERTAGGNDVCRKEWYLGMVAGGKGAEENLTRKC